MDAELALYKQQVQAKQEELDALQASFDEFTASSQELEDELEEDARRVCSEGVCSLCLRHSVHARRRAESRSSRWERAHGREMLRI
jgi:hypothetical protein